jgi:uncharacterized protein (TIGR03435 family)
MNNVPRGRRGAWRRALATAATLGALAAPVALAARGESPASHRGRRGTPLPGALRSQGVDAQVPQPGPPAPAFEVASIKPNNSGDGRVMMSNQPGRYTASNVTLRLLIRNAYQLQDFQISGGPGWISSDHFDIVAKIDASVQDEIAAAGPRAPGEGPGRLQLMIRSLLAERFKLVVHTETKEQPIYALVLARSDGRLGPQLKKSETDCAAVFAAARGRGPGRGVPPPGPPQPGDPIPCGIRIGMGNMAVGGAPLAQFANTLGMFTGRVVQDRTGLTGNYDFNLTWTPDQMPQRAPGTPADQPIRVNGIDIDPNGPSIFTALQEQLGLKLDSQRGPVEMLVIDRAEHPVED